MPIAQGSAKQVRIKRQGSKGTLAGATLGQIMRRETSTWELAKEAYTTESEQTSRRQLTSSRHGVKIVNGKLTGLWSPGTYADPLSAVLFRDFTTVAAITGASITVAGAGPTYTLTRAAGSYLTDGIKIGMCVRITAGAFAAANLNKNLLVTGVTALVLTVVILNAGSVAALAAEGPIVSATVTVPGKVTWTPISGHTNIYYTVESWYPDVPYSERTLDAKFTAVTCSLPGTGNAKIDFTGIGLDQTTSTAVYYSAPTAETTSEVLVAAGGALLVGGVSQAIVTDLTFTIDAKGAAADGVVGTNVRPDVFTGKCVITGSFTAYFDSATLPDVFLNETSTTIVSAITAGSTANAEFVTLTLSKMDLNSSSSDDPETGLKRSYTFVGEYNSAGGAGLATEQTTLLVQDSLAA